MSALLLLLALGAAAHTPSQLEVWATFSATQVDVDLAVDAPLTGRLAQDPEVGDAIRTALQRDVEVWIDGSPVPLVVSLPDAEAPSSHPGHPRALMRVTAALPPAASTFQWVADPKLGPVVLSLRWPEAQEIRVQRLQPGEPSEPVSVWAPGAGPPAGRVMRAYLGEGFSHVLPRGLDHLLFLVALALPRAPLRRLAAEVTAFTAAHALTLTVVVLGLLPGAPRLVEPLIAASIVAMALDAALGRQPHRWRSVVVLGFGLAHGMGFASALAETGLPRRSLLPALLGFHAGVEAAQLVVVFATLALVAWMPARGRRWVSRLGGLAIAAVAAWWTVDRLL